LNIVTFQDNQDCRLISGHTTSSSDALYGSESNGISGEGVSGAQEDCGYAEILQRINQEMGARPPRWQNVNQILLLAIRTWIFCTLPEIPGG
jgi:hypothetical protein